MLKNSVLLVEDDPDTIKLLSVLFNLEKIEYKSPDSLDENTIVDQIVSHRYGKLIIDVNISNLNGIELVKRIRHEIHDYHPQIIMFSGLDLRERCLAAGADTFFQKPFDPGKLVAVLKAKTNTINSENSSTLAS